MKTLQEKKLKSSIRAGDIYRLGDHMLACGDSQDPTLIKKLIGKEKVDLILTDPPYGVSYVESKKHLKEGKTQHKKIRNDHIQSEYEYRKFSEGWLNACANYMNTTNAFYIFNADRMIFSLREALRASNFHFTQLLIWVKNQAVMGRMDYLSQHELIAYGWKRKHAFYKSKDKSILTYPKPNKSKLHPTMKPVGLLRRLILNSSEIGGFVYDPFGGSGSTLIACQQTKRRCRMVEIDPLYCEVILNRFEKLTGIKPIKL